MVSKRLRSGCFYCLFSATFKVYIMFKFKCYHVILSIGLCI